MGTALFLDLDWSKDGCEHANRLCVLFAMRGCN